MPRMSKKQQIAKAKSPAAASPAPKRQRVLGPEFHHAQRYDPEKWKPGILARLESGDSLYEACAAQGPGAPTADVVMKWVKKDPTGFGLQYAHARETGYLLLGDKIDKLAAETHTYTLVPETDAEGQPLYDEHGQQRVRRVLVPLSSDVIASKRLQVDTLKWKLAKMLPKVYGERLTQQHVGPEDGAVKVEVSTVFDQILSNLELKRRGDGGE